MKKSFRRQFRFALLLAFVWAYVLYTVAYPVAFFLAEIWYYSDFYDYLNDESSVAMFLGVCLVWQLARMIFCRAVVTADEFKVYPNLLRGIIQWPKVYPMSSIEFVDRKKFKKKLILELKTQSKPKIVRCGFLDFISLRELKKYIEETMYKKQDGWYESFTNLAKQTEEMEARFKTNYVLDPEIASYNESFTVNAAFIKRSKRFRFWFIMFILVVSGFGGSLPALSTDYNAGYGIDAFSIIVTLGVGIFIVLVGLIAYAIMFRDTSVVPSTVAIRGGRIYFDDDSYDINDISDIVMTDPEERSGRVYNGRHRGYRYTRTGVLRHIVIQLRDGSEKTYYFGTVFDKKEQCENYSEIYQALLKCVGRRNSSIIRGQY